MTENKKTFFIFENIKPKKVVRACGKVPAIREQVAAGPLEGVAGYVESGHTATCRGEWVDCHKSKKGSI